MDSTPASTSTARKEPPPALAPLRALLFACAVLWSIWANATRPPVISGAIDSLHADIDRQRASPSMLLVRVDASRNTGAATQDPDRVLDRVAVRIADEFLDARVPLAPPAAAVEGWLDTHGMYLLPISSHPALAQRLEREPMEASIAAIRARLSSPVHGVGGLNPRRDPLSLQPLLFGERGAMSYVDMDGRAAATGTGDLRARHADSLLIGLRGDADEVRVREIAARVSESDPVRIDLVGVRAQDGRRRRLLEELLPRLALLLLSAGIAAVAFAQRSTTHALRAAAISIVSVACIAPFGPPLDPLTTPVWCALLGTCVAVSACPPARRSKGAVVLVAAALSPLLTLPYPPWHDMAWLWPAAISLAVTLRWCTRSAPSSRAAPDVGPAPSASLAQAPSFATRARAVAICVGVFLIASLTLQRFDVTPSSSFQFGSTRAHEIERTVAREFFVARNIVRFESEGTTVNEVLDRSPLTLQPLRALLGDIANRADSPGSFVLPGELLESRRRSLRTLNIDEKIGDLREILRSQGFRDEAFNEFLNGATELRRFPDATAALESGLGEWIRRFIRTEDERVVLTHELELRRADPAFLPTIAAVGTARGAAISTMIELRDFEASLAKLLLTQLWIITFVVWASTRSMVEAITAGLCAAGTLAAVLVLTTSARFSMGAPLFPVLMICGASAGAITQIQAAGGGRSWKSWFCVWQASAGLALLSTGQPGWIELGLTLSFGLVVAVGFGRFVAPGIGAVLSGGAHTRASPTAHGEPAEQEHGRDAERAAAAPPPEGSATPQEEEPPP